MITEGSISCLGKTGEYCIRTMSRRDEREECIDEDDDGLYCHGSCCVSIEESEGDSPDTVEASVDGCVVVEDQSMTQSVEVEPSRDLVREELESRAGHRLILFPKEEDVCSLDAGGSTLAIFLSFEGEARMDKCWKHLYHMCTVSTDVWISRWRSRAFSYVSCAPEGVYEEGECSMIFLLDLHRPLSGSWTREGLERRAEAFLGCSRSRGGKRPIVLRDAVMTVEVLLQSERERWIEERSDVLEKCERLVDLVEIDPEREVKCRGGKAWSLADM